MTQRKEDIQPKRTVKRQKTEGNKVSRRQVIKSIGVGGLALGMVGAAGAEALAGHSIIITTSPEEARRFVIGLTEPTFRERLTKSPREVFAEFHMEIPKRFIPEPLVLPPVEQVRATLAELEKVGQLSPQLVIPVFLAFFAFFAFFRK